MTTATDRGWGPWDEKYQRARQTTIVAGGVKLTVRREVAHLFKGFIDEIVSKGYPVARVADDWGFAFRTIRGSKAPSNHSWGLAADLNATTNPMTSDGRVHSDMPNWVPDVAARWGFFWGGNYKGSRKDPMHFEFLLTPADVSRFPLGAREHQDHIPAAVDLKEAALQLNAPVFAYRDNPGAGGGGWYFCTDGGVFPVDGAPGFGSAGNLKLNAPICDVKVGASGYALIAEDGGVFPFGNIAVPTPLPAL